MGDCDSQEICRLCLKDPNRSDGAALASPCGQRRGGSGYIYHSGIRPTVARSTLADANAKRDWRSFADFAHVLIDQASTLYAGEPFGVELQQAAYA